MNLLQLYAIIKRFEGCRLTPYLCPAGRWTCGWGSTGKDVFPGRVWTQEYADKRMQEDAQRFAAGAARLCPNLPESALCAVADFAYNLGLGNLQASTFRRKVNARDWVGARRQIIRWCRANGRVLRGLQVRRAAEAALLP